MSPHAVEIDVRGNFLQKDRNAETYDLICVGFGPASLAIAIALHDARKAQAALPGLSNLRDAPPRVLFLERQEAFGWHSGMLLPGAKMQISFVKDLATMRDPRSHFTFLNYLHKKGRLAQFTNLDTFLPRRIEYADYMTWCASHFEDVVQYGQEVSEVTAMAQGGSQVTGWRIEARDVKTRTSQYFSARNIVLATGGKPQIPPPFPEHHERVIHSSNYRHAIGRALPDRAAAYNIAVVGSGQSSAECFHNLQSRYPNSKTRLLIRGSALRPSDDSPL
jgi:L-ornithine N5-oxygenase